MALAQVLAERYPQFFQPWQKRVGELPDAALRDLLDRVPNERISQPGREFVLAFLATSRRFLQETG